jgi:hypothetical protein
MLYSLWGHRSPTVTGGGTLALLSARIEAQQSEEVVQRLGASREFLPVTR